MKTYIKASSDLHLKDILKEINYFVVVDDIQNCNFGVIYADDELEDSDDEYYASLPDDVLLQLPKEEISSIDNVFVLDRLVRLDKSKLNAQQLKLLRQEYKKQVKLDRTDITYLIEKFNQCNTVFVANRDKNNAFIAEYKLTKRNILAILHSLKPSDFSYRTRNINYNYLGNHLIVAKPHIIIPHKNIMIGVNLYIKLDIDESTKKCAAYISIHPQQKSHKTSK